MRTVWAAASCALENVPCDDGGGSSMDATGLFVTVVLVVAAIVLFGVLLLGRSRR
ncbi:hypothetical protein E9228_001920 [Curtobacterium flaccumfaciens]|uniref:LPXTG cell wall anchor domain-containing protein n=1 Tax=Curtobacterium salicis TaxID=1779862 RepID=A0ABX0T8P8_9MICO|nr:hypothetical protein [Curtobacterium sp. WW7]NII41273.1 hypothetical protein [Curtobacterium sp. WW7]